MRFSKQIRALTAVFFSLFQVLQGMAQHEIIDVPLRFGHPDIEVWSVALDKTQLSYIHTNHGLFRYDGRNLEALKWPSAKSRVNCAVVTGDSLISGDENGVITVISTETGQLISSDTVSSSAITSIHPAAKGKLILSTAGSGICLMLPEGKKHCISGILSDDFVNHIVLRPDHSIIACTDRGIDLISIQNRDSLVHIKTLDCINDLYTDVLPIGHSGQQAITVGLATGLQLISDSVCSALIPFDEMQVASIDLFAGLDRQWALINGTKIFQIVQIGNQWTFHLFAELQAPAISIGGLQEGFLMAWLENGRLQLIPADYLHIQSAGNQLLKGITAICANPKGGIWAACGDTLIAVINNAGVPEIQQKIILKRQGVFPVISLASTQNHLLAGTFGDGLYVYDTSNNHQTGHINGSQESASHSILDIVTNGDKVWISTLSGVEEFACCGATETTTLEGSPGYVYCLFLTGQDELLIGSQGTSLHKAENGVITSASAEKHQHSVIHLAAETDTGVWALTSDSEVYFFDGDKLNAHPLNKALSGLAAYRLFQYPSGGVGLISPHAIYHITKSSAAEIIGGPKLFASDFQNISSTDIDGNLWVARADGLLMISSHALQTQYLPQTTIRSVSANNELVPSSENTFKHASNDLRFGLLSVWHDPYRPVAHEYRLIGQDSLWRSVVQAELTFARLQPGDYRLEIRTLFGHLMNPVHYTQYAFSILPPFYVRWWFIAGVFLLLLFITLWIIKLREQRLQRAMALKSERILSQFEMLKNQINPHFLFNSFNTLAALISDNPEKAEDFTEKLSGYFREILAAQDNDTNTLERELRLAEDFIFLQQSRYGENLRYSTEINPAKLSCHLPALTLQILLENAVKHNQISSQTPLNVHIYTTGNSLVVSNNLQLRSTKPESTGLGLSNMSNRFEILTGKTPEITTDDGNFNVIIPLEKCV